MTKAELGLATVQQLYLLQVQLFNVLDMDLSDPDLQKEAKKQTREFETLLKEADWRYMGGEDVYEELTKLPVEVKAKLKNSPVVERTKARAHKQRA
ncbi:hypothetical protein A3D88_00105 [Candidatus Peribacteria bacterium RIFCSPHIGHO2_02_FULL_52_16]|nr:MAG: hypothetical protein A2706_01090 [Candidatus Peribacteria bacterium RIFCSPHIGHO2_01_FULL_51_35]OGJ61527.1 MAG: hypothetical protein A3D88_00105 [Candidatus Peribacteria bacterium RIFCSPHIGHO2_02_FULL_52_16]